MQYWIYINVVAYFYGKSGYVHVLVILIWILR